MYGMKKATTTLLVFFGLLITLQAQTFQFDSIGYKSMEIGKVIIKNDAWILRVDKGSYHTDYWPVNLPEKFWIENQEVVFEGALGRIPTNAKLNGTPIELNMIRILYRTKQNNANGEKIVTEDTNTQNFLFDSVGYINNESGKIILISNTYVIEQNINGEIKRYVPDFLPDDFKIENTTITFSGNIGKIPANVRMMGTPLKIKELMLVEEVPFDKNKIQEPLQEFYPFDSAGYLKPTRGVIKLMSSGPNVFVIEITDQNNAITRYLPAILPIDFQKEGIAVTISGTIGKVPANVRMMGTPITLDAIVLDK